MPDRPCIDILLATRDGARHLDVQLDSLWGQSDQGFRILARDDQSTDSTRQILRRHGQAHPGRLVIIPDGGIRLGARGSFAELIRHGTSPYAMFCDQDDRWHVDKIARSMERMRELERRLPVGSPALTHGDLHVVDAQLRTIAPSLAGFECLDLVRGRTVRRLLVQNVVTGCTMLMNRPLLDRCRHIPAEATMHDHWIALVAAVMGAIDLVPGTLIDYRQHAANTIGALRHGIVDVLHRHRDLDRSALRQRIRVHRRQALALLRIHGHELRRDDHAACRRFVGIGSLPFLQRRLEVVRHGLWKHGLLRNVGWMVCL